MPSETEELLEIAPASQPKPELQILPEPSAWPVWVIGSLGFLATLAASGFAVLFHALRHAGDGAPGPAPGITALMVMWAPAIYFGLLTASCLPGVDAARVSQFLSMARVVLAVFVVLLLMFLSRHDPSPRLIGIFLLMLLGTTAACEGSWSYLRRRKRWDEL